MRSHETSIRHLRIAPLRFRSINAGKSNTFSHRLSRTHDARTIHVESIRQSTRIVGLFDENLVITAVLGGLGLGEGGESGDAQEDGETNGELKVEGLDLLLGEGGGGGEHGGGGSERDGLGLLEGLGDSLDDGGLLGDGLAGLDGSLGADGDGGGSGDGEHLCFKRRGLDVDVEVCGVCAWMNE